LALKQFQPFLPKLSVLPKDSVPISILNLRSASKTREGEALERELTLLLYSRLVSQKEVFVLERQRLEKAGEEKELGDREQRAFLSGSYLVEGIIDKEGASRERITLSAGDRTSGRADEPGRPD